MCGFLSVVSREIFLEDDIEKFKAASDLIIHRGPDDTYQILDKYYFSVFHRLSIRDLSSLSRQPLITKCGKFIICFNGEIYNIDELNSLFIETKDLKSDTLIISYLISNFGVEAVNFLRGMFAITIFDRINKRFYLVRDPFGIKPLFYFKSSNNRFFIASSEIKALLPFIKDLKPDITQSMRFLMMGVSNDNNDTFFEEIKSVPKGNIIEITQSFDIKVDKLKSNLNNTNLSLSNSLSKERHTTFLIDNVREHLVADVPIATTISGGVDSSLVSSIVNKYSIKSNMFTAFSKNFESEISEKREFELKDKLIKVDCNLSDTSNYINLMIKKLSAPFESSSWIYQDILMQRISSEFNYKVLLVGEGADEIYSGYKRLFYPYLYGLEKSGDIELFRSSIFAFQEFLGIKVSDIEKKYDDFKNKLYLETDYEDKMFSKYLNFNLIDLQYERYYPMNGNLVSSDPEIFYKNHLLSYINRADIPSTLYILDILSMSHGLELRVPFLDSKLFEEVMSYSFKNNFSSGFNKFILRKSSVLLSDDIRWNKVKKQRPTAISTLVYDTLAEEIMYLLSQDNIFINTASLNNDFNSAIKIRDSQFARFMFRVYTFLKFWHIYF